MSEMHMSLLPCVGSSYGSSSHVCLYGHVHHSLASVYLGPCAENQGYGEIKRICDTVLGIQSQVLVAANMNLQVRWQGINIYRGQEALPWLCHSQGTASYVRAPSAHHGHPVPVSQLASKHCCCRRCCRPGTNMKCLDAQSSFLFWLMG